MGYYIETGTNSEIYSCIPTDYGYWVIHGNYTPDKVGYNGQHLGYAYRDTLVAETTLCAYGEPIILSDGSLLIGSMGPPCAYPYDDPNQQWHYFFRVLPDGHVDPTFNHSVNGPILKMLRYDASRVLLGGEFSQYDNTLSRRICRIDTLGNLDTSFQSIFTSGLVTPLHVQPDGEIIVSGNFTIQNHSDTLGLARLNIDGSLDSTFNNFNGIHRWDHGSVLTVYPTSDAGLLVGGRFTHYQGMQRGSIAKTDANGYLKPQYFTGTGFDGVPNGGGLPTVHSISRVTNDQYYVMGRFNSYNGQPSQPVIRLNGPLTVGVGAELEQPAFSLYPNPASGKVTVELSPLSGSGATIKLHDLLGRQVLARPFLGAREEIAVDHLQKGLYLVSVTDARGQQWQQKLIVQ